MAETSMSGKVVLVTGATSGLGEAAASALAAKGATVVVGARDPARGEAAVERIRAATGSTRLHVATADLASLQEVRDLAQDVERRFDRLDVLVNNAGVDMGTRVLTRDGFELSFAVNYLAPFLLTTLLLDLLKRSGPSRVLCVASSAYRGGAIDFEDLQSERRFGQRAYNNSKLALVLFTYELARRLEGAQVTANCVDPGFVRGTHIGTTLPRLYQWAGTVMWPFMAPVARGAETIVWAASSPDVAQASGQYFKSSRPQKTGPKTHDRDVARRLWEVSERLVASAANGDRSE